MTAAEPLAGAGPPPPLPAARITSSPVRDLLALTERPEVISFAGGLPATELLDVDAMRAAAETALAGTAARRALQYSATEGLAPLREQLAQLLTDDGVAASTDRVLVTSGSQQAISLIAQVLLRPGEPVLVEQPTYLAALQAFAAVGAVPIAVPSDADGPLPDALTSLVREHSARLLYLAPTFQNPSGRTIPAQRRHELAAAIGSAQLWTIEDEAYRELAYDGAPPAPIAADPAAAGCVVSLRTLSKVAAPGLRVGWVAAPPQLLRALAIAKQATDLHTAGLTQATASAWLAAGHLPGQVARLRAAYRERRDAMLGLLEQTLPPGSSWARPAGGMFIWARLPDGADASDALQQALRHDVAYVPGAAFYAGDPDRAALRLSFTSHAPPRLAEGLARLATALAPATGS